MKEKGRNNMEECSPKILSEAYKIASSMYPKGTQITTEIIDSIIKELKEKK